MSALRTVGPRVAWPWLLAAIALTSPGCGGGPRLTLDKDVARQALAAFLDSWVRGERLEELRSRPQAIVGSDPDWSAGRKLMRYKIGQETDDGTNLHVDAEVVLGSERGAEVTQQVTYIVGTSPVVTVFRKEE
ncbi:MAG: hypothetical protein J5I93_01095 [Pirellulaceae bacterium]|nr:hypothetical protein [Pirellulaceae bacterium]